MLDAPAFTAFPLDRADRLRRDDAALAALRARSDARAAVLWRLKPLLHESEGRFTPAWVPPVPPAAVAAESVFLGLAVDGAPVFALALDAEAEPDAAHLRDPAAGARFVELRQAAGAMDPGEASILGAARSLFAWHASHRFCAACGARSEPTLGGWKRICSACGTEHFPRVDPVVIMLIVREDRVLLGRGPTWPPGRFSCLAGFVEPGETAPDAARREAHEEAGVRLGEVSFLTSQPWPFPSCLMLGLRAEALTEEIVVDPHELAEARWFSRAEVEAMFAGAHPEARIPPPEAVAHHLLRWWVEQARQPTR